jgi:predicted small lipoprotein YifL
MVRRIAIVAALFAALGLSACGRKGALDAPPAALNAAGEEVPQDDAGTVLRPGSDKRLPVIRGPNKRIPLDALLD